MSPQKNTNPKVQSIFATKESLQEAIDYAKAQLPITTDNQLTTILMVYHNTLLNQVACLNNPD